MKFHLVDPTPLIEATFRRIHTERMADLPLLNPALDVAAVGFERKEDEWRGVLVTPWCINLLLLPTKADWPVPDSHERVFRQYASGNFAFLGNHEEGLGDYLSCALIHDMKQFADQETAVLTARASLIALDLTPAQNEADAAAPASSARRKFLNLGG
ncbi:MAG: [NiFe]-hydrogenase assembly chaperone HybE [Rhodocyclaceae bacterium]|nr:[NiFe]-hydrogenase assembly chaperone HybE [Rhodocyclaceae bacterium]